MKTAEEILNEELWFGSEPSSVQIKLIKAMKIYANEKLDEAAKTACDSIEAYPSEYEKIQESILKLKDTIQ